MVDTYCPSTDEADLQTVNTETFSQKERLIFKRESINEIREDEDNGTRNQLRNAVRKSDGEEDVYQKSALNQRLHSTRTEENVAYCTQEHKQTIQL